MATLTSILPAPSQPIYSVQEEHPIFQPQHSHPARKQVKQVPPYGQREGFIPRTPEDFGDGGAFPEIHVAQYPLDMGRKKGTSEQQVVPLQLDSSGRVKYEAILGHGKPVFSQFTDLIEKQVTEDELARPNEEEIAETTQRTRAALEKLVSGKIQAAQPSAPVKQTTAPTYIKYTPAQQGVAFNSGAKQRIIRMVEMPKDPLEPPKFKHKRVPRGPPSPPVPVMHSPPRKVTVKDQQMWKIPPCISNWKNSKGYTIPLDKRLAADGRGLQEVQINDKFAKLSESLYIAERSAREEVSKRAQIQKKIMLKEKEKKEEMLRNLAAEARSQRGGAPVHEPEDDDTASLSKSDRDRIREERGRERQRELRLEAAGKKTKLSRDEDRDVSEKIALGQAATGPQSEEALYDQRLFNQSQGLDPGFGDDEAYNLYSKPLFAGSSANVIYRPKKNEEDWGSESDVQKLLSTSKFKPDKDWEGVDRSKASEPRAKPVEFEKEEADPFGLDEFLNTAKKSKRPLDKIGSKGHLHAGSTGAKDYMYEQETRDSKRKKIDFEKPRK